MFALLEVLLKGYFTPKSKMYASPLSHSAIDASRLFPYELRSLTDFSRRDVCLKIKYDRYLWHSVCAAQSANNNPLSLV